MGKYVLPRFADQIVYRAKCFECPSCEGWNDELGQFDCGEEECVGQQKRVIPSGPEYERARRLEVTDSQLLNRLASMPEWGQIRSSAMYREALTAVYLLQADIKRISSGKCCGLYEGQILGWWVDEDTKELVLRYRQGGQ